MRLNILSGGAAAQAVRGIQDAFERETGCAIDGKFSAVGEMRDQLLAGTACDLVILTAALVAQLVESGHVVDGSARSLGLVHTGIAVRTGEPQPRVDTAAALAKAFGEAQAIYCPDTVKSTAGIHFRRVLGKLGLEQTLAARLREFPNGATAMKAMAECDEPGLLGCTQVTEINYTPGVTLVANLPPEFELATDYTVGVCTGSPQPALAEKFAQWLAGPQSRAVRRAGGVEFIWS